MTSPLYSHSLLALSLSFSLFLSFSPISLPFSLSLSTYSSRLLQPTMSYVSISALLGASAVGLGAFGAHAMKGKYDEKMTNAFEVGVRYQMYHAIALLSLSLFHLSLLSRDKKEKERRETLESVMNGLIWGISLFSGSLYALVFTDIKKLGIVTPIGGTVLIYNWLRLAFAGF